MVTSLLVLCSENIPANDHLLKEKALQFANELNIEGFKTLEGWLTDGGWEVLCILELIFFNVSLQ